MTEQPRPTIAQQIAAVEMMLVNRRGHADVIRGLVDKRKRSKEELAIAEMYIPELQQALQTLRFVEKHANAVRALAKQEASGDVQGSSA